MSTNKTEPVEVNGYGYIDIKNEDKIIYTLFYLHMFHALFSKMWNNMAINWHLVTLFIIQYIHNLDGINHRLCLFMGGKKCDYVNEHICYSKYWR